MNRTTHEGATALLQLARRYGWSEGAIRLLERCKEENKPKEGERDDYGTSDTN